MINFRELYDKPEQTVASLCEINYINLHETMVQHPSLYAYAAAGYRTAEVQRDRAKVALERKRVELMVEAINTEEKIAQWKAEAIVATDPRLVALNEDYLTAAHKASVLRALVDGLEHRRDMIIQLGSDQRKEKFHT